MFSLNIMLLTPAFLPDATVVSSLNCPLWSSYPNTGLSYVYIILIFLSAKGAQIKLLHLHV